jgi:NAD(P)-dependent dehydrogenase (short-subunit alcohol dehydrogenase family)
MKLGKVEGKALLATGAVSAARKFDSIGSATVREFLEEGGRGVIIGDINDVRGKEFEQELNETYGKGKALYVHLDVRNLDDQKNAFAKAEELFGHVDCIFANAGVVSSEMLDSMEIEEVMKNYDFLQSINNRGMALTAFLGGQHMIKRGVSGTIVLTSSIHGLVARPHTEGLPTFDLLSYIESKHGNIGLAKGLAIQLAKYGIRVNTINPGYTQTPLFIGGADASPNEESLDTAAYAFNVLDTLHPLYGGRMVRPQEIAKPVVFLLSDDSSFITGQYHVVDGGYSAQ